MDDFQSFIDQISKEDMDIALLKAQRFSDNPDKRAFSIALSLIELYHCWQNDSAGAV